MNRDPNCDPLDAGFWEDAWADVLESSPIHASQRARPEDWVRFYDEVSPIWLEMLGEGREVGRRVAEHLLREGLVLPRGAVLEVGCGPGALALALAERGVNVTAVDTSRGMIACLEKESKRRGMERVRSHCLRWEDLEPSPAHDLVTAAFFPQAMSPGGIRRLEAFSRGACALVVGTGEESLPFRRLLWDRLAPGPPPRPGLHLACAVNYLLASGRKPCLKHIEWPFRFDVWEKTVRRYYRAYFALFGNAPASVDKAMTDALNPFLEARRIQATGRHSIAVVWWRPPVRIRRADLHAPSRRPNQ